MDDWKELAEQMRAAGDPWTSPALPRFYQLAHALGPVILGRQGVPSADVEDLVSDLIHAKLHLIIAAEGPKAYFCMALRNCAETLRRRRVRFVDDVPPARLGETRTTTVDRAIEARLSLPVVYAVLTEREREVLAAIHEGGSRDDIAATLRTSRANIDQIVSRARVKLRNAGLP